MSYDIFLFPAVAGQDPAVTAQCDAEIDDPLSDEGRARNTCIVAGLMAHTPKFEIYEFNEGVQISTLDDDGTYIQIELFNSEAAIRIPYWPKKKTHLISMQLDSYLQIIARETGFLAFDPQAEKLIDPAVGVGDSLHAHPVRVMDRHHWDSLFY